MPSLRAPAERANAQLKTWRILRKLRCCPWRAGQLAKAIHVLQAREIGGERFTVSQADTPPEAVRLWFGFG
jgi:hypothetical protein